MSNHKHANIYKHKTQVPCLPITTTTTTCTMAQWVQVQVKPTGPCRQGLRRWASNLEPPTSRTEMRKKMKGTGRNPEQSPAWTIIP